MLIGVSLAILSLLANFYIKRSIKISAILRSITKYSKHRQIKI